MAVKNDLFNVFGICLLLNSSSILNHLKLPAAAVAGTCSAAVPIQSLHSGAVVFFVVAVLFRRRRVTHANSRRLPLTPAALGAASGSPQKGYFSEQMLTLVNCS